MTDEFEVRTHETIYISITRARHLKGHRSDLVTSFAKVEFDGKHLGDSTKVETSPDTDAEYNFKTTLDCTMTESNQMFDDIASKPILVTVVEVLPKEKKQKEEKLSILGQCTIDLQPLLSKSLLDITASLELQSCPGSPLESVQGDQPKAELDFSISVNEPLLDGNQLQHSNILTVRIGSLYSLPETWTAVGTQFNYTIGLPVPVNNEKDDTLLCGNGSFKLASEREQSKRKMKWHCVPNSVAHSQYIATRLQSRISRTRLWPVEVMRISSSQVKGIGGVAPGAGGKKDKSVTDEDGQVSYHGVAYVDLSPLLYPGVNSVAGAFKVHAFSETELLAKIKRKSGIADCAARAQSSTSRVTGSSPVQKGKSQGVKEGATVPSKKGSGVKQSESSTEAGDTAHTVVNTEGTAYEDANSYVYLEFLLATPMVPRREPEDLAELVREYIPARPQLKRAVGGAEKAIEDFHSQLSSVAVMVLDEFRESFGNNGFALDSEQYSEIHQDRKRQLLYQLNSSGKYFAFKEQLKHSVVKIVREKYMKTTVFQNKDELQHFLSELYVYLLDEMHLALQKVLSVECKEKSSIEPFLNSVQMKMFAEEAEVNGDLDEACKYYQERLAVDDKNPDHWFDFGSFNLFIGNNTKAKECFKEAVALQQTYINGLLMYGIMCTIEESYEEAEAIFERATSLSEINFQAPCLAWTILALFYDIQGNEIRAEHSYSEASKPILVNPTLSVAPKEEPKPNIDADVTASGSYGKPHVPGSAKSVSTVKGSKTSTKKVTRVKSSTENSVASYEADDKVTESVEVRNDQQKQTNLSKETTESVFLQAAKWLLDRKALRFAENALSHELLSSLGHPSAEYYIALARLNMMRKKFVDAETSLESAISLNNEHPDAWSMKGHLNYVAGNYVGARECYERTLAFVADASETHAIYLRLGSIYLQEEQFSEAKRIFLTACKHSPTSLSWYGVGVACYRLGELEEAEDALAEANILNNKNADVWAYLSLVCLKTNRKLEAEQSYKHALKLGVTDNLILKEVHHLQNVQCFGNPSF